MKHLTNLIISLIGLIIINSCKKELVDYSKDIAELKASVSQLQKKSDSLTAALLLANTNNQNLSKSVDSIVSQIAIVIKQINTLNETSLSANADIKSINAQIANLNQQYQDLLAKLNAIKISKLSVRIIGDGTFTIDNLSTGESKTIKSDSIINFTQGDKIKIKSIPASNSLFDGYSGLINDSLYLVTEKSLQIIDNSLLTVKFVLKNPGNKKIQNEFFDDTKLEYRASGNVIVWWDKSWDHNSLAKDFLKWANFILNKSTGWGMKLPRGSENVYINVYLHHKSGEGGPNKDIFDDGWGQGVGTDKFGMPFYTAPLSPNPIIREYYCTCYGNIFHEFFHIAQYESSRTTFLANDSKWIIESSASWFETYFGKNENWNGDFGNIPSFTFEPQLKLWGGGFQDGKPKTWTRAVRAYASQIFLLYLTWNKIISDDFIGKAFASNTKLTPQEYFYNNIKNFEDVYRKFALNLIVKENIPSYAKSGIIDAENWLINYGYRLEQEGYEKNDDNRYILKLKDTGTNGFHSPLESTQAWSYQTAKIENTKSAKYKVEFIGEKSGTSGTISNFYAGYIIEKSATYTYSNIELNSQSGIKEIEVPENSILYIVPISTPKVFQGNEYFNYKIKIDKVN